MQECSFQCHITRNPLPQVRLIDPIIIFRFQDLFGMFIEYGRLNIGSIKNPYIFLNYQLNHSTTPFKGACSPHIPQDGYEIIGA